MSLADTMSIFALPWRGPRSMSAPVSRWGAQRFCGSHAIPAPSIANASAEGTRAVSQTTSISWCGCRTGSMRLENTFPKKTPDGLRQRQWVPNLLPSIEFQKNRSIVVSFVSFGLALEAHHTSASSYIQSTFVLNCTRIKRRVVDAL